MCQTRPHNSCSHDSLLKTGDILSPKVYQCVFQKGVQMLGLCITIQNHNVKCFSASVAEESSVQCKN